MSAEQHSLFTALRQKVEAAFAEDEGPWIYDGRDIFTRSHVGATAHHLIVPLPETWHESQRVSDAIAQHIAACDPSTILALLDRLAELEKLVPPVGSDRSFSL